MRTKKYLGIISRAPSSSKSGALEHLPVLFVLAFVFGLALVLIRLDVTNLLKNF